MKIRGKSPSDELSAQDTARLLRETVRRGGGLKQGALTDMISGQGDKVSTALGGQIARELDATAFSTARQARIAELKAKIQAGETIASSEDVAKKLIEQTAWDEVSPVYAFFDDEE